jgi:hypothetical protein
MIDTLKLAKGLERAGMTAGQSESIAVALQDAQSDYLTKADLESALSKLKAELTKEIGEAKFQMIWGLAIVVGVQVISHFWH